MPTAAEIESLIRSTAANYGVDPNLAVALARRESSLSPYAVGSAGEVGVFQLTAGAAQDVGANRNTLEGNIQGGVLYLRRMLNQFQDPYLAVAAYNAGPGNVSRGVIPTSTQAYASDVLTGAGYGANVEDRVPVFETTVWGVPSEAAPASIGSIWPWLLGLGVGLFALAWLRR